MAWVTAKDGGACRTLRFQSDAEKPRRLSAGLALLISKNRLDYQLKVLNKSYYTLMYRIAFGIFIPVIYAVIRGSTYSFAFSVTGIGVFLFILSSILEEIFYKKNHSEITEKEDESIDIPVWVSSLGLVSIGLIPSGLLVALLLLIGLI